MNKILLVEDNSETAELVCKALKINKFDVDIAVNGLEGYDKFINNEYDLVLLDLEMPKMNGEELLIKIRNINPYIDIIVYTNYSKFGDIKKLVNLGINGYINKGPEADLKELIGMIRSKLEPVSENEMKYLINDTESMRVD